MIGFLNGVIRDKKATELLVDVNGVGYLCKTSLTTSEQIGVAGDPVELYIQTQVREDDISLYGFISELDKDIFLRIISISGVGPKLAMALQSSFNPTELLEIIRGGQVFMLTKVPGVGKKTAERLVLELQDKFKIIGVKHGLQSSDGSAFKTEAKNFNKIEEAILAMEALGFQRRKSEEIVNKVISNEPELTIEELIRHSLKAMR